MRNMLFFKYSFAQRLIEVNVTTKKANKQRHFLSVFCFHFV